MDNHTPNLVNTTQPQKETLSTPILITVAIALILIWGSAFTLVTVGVRHISPIWLVAYRLCIGAVAITSYAYFRGRRFPPLNDSRWKWYFGLGLTGTVLPFFLISTGQLVVDSGLSAIIVGAMPLMTIILAHFITDEKLTPRKTLGFVIGFLGIIVLFFPDTLSLSLVSDWKSQLLIVGAAVFYAITTVVAKKAPDTPPSLAAAMMTISAAISALFAATLTGFPESVPPLPGIGAAIGLGLGSSGMAAIIYLYVIKEAGPSTLAKINYFVPAASVMFGVWFLSEPLTWRIVISCLIIGLGVIISHQKNKPAEVTAHPSDP